LILLSLVLVGTSLGIPCFGAAGKDTIARPGVPISAGRADRDWPEGVLELLNDPLRREGWHSWFSGLPNDVERYRFQLTKEEEINHLIRRFAAIKSDQLRIRLAAAEGPVVKHGGVRAPGVLFAIGHQRNIDVWYSRFAEIERVATITREREVACQVSLETPMACGIGICFSCVAQVREPDGTWDYKRTCVEGPVFDAQEIEW